MEQLVLCGRHVKMARSRSEASRLGQVVLRRLSSHINHACVSRCRFHIVSHGNSKRILQKFLELLWCTRWVGKWVAFRLTLFEFENRKTTQTAPTIFTLIRTREDAYKLPNPSRNLTRVLVVFSFDYIISITSRNHCRYDDEVKLGFEVSFLTPTSAYVFGLSERFVEAY